MVAGFQDISSEDENEDNIKNIQNSSETPQKFNSSFDVDIELTSDESDAVDGNEITTGTEVTISKVVDSDDDEDDKSNTEMIIEPSKSKVRND